MESDAHFDFANRLNNSSSLLGDLLDDWMEDAWFEDILPTKKRRLEDVEDERDDTFPSNGLADEDLVNACQNLPEMEQVDEGVAEERGQEVERVEKEEEGVEEDFPSCGISDEVLLGACHFAEDLEDFWEQDAQHFEPTIFDRFKIPKSFFGPSTSQAPPPLKKRKISLSLSKKNKNKK